jgi:hypothetical protein
MNIVGIDLVGIRIVVRIIVDMGIFGIDVVCMDIAGV